MRHTPLRFGPLSGELTAFDKEHIPMKLRLIALAALAAAATAGSASAQPPARGGFGLLQFDANADGRLTRAEFDTAQRQRFNSIDANKDGTATAEEFKAYHQAQGKARRADMLKARFEALDADDNGQLSPSEFEARPERDGARGPGRHGAAGRRNDGQPRHGGKRGPMAADADRSVTFEDFSARGVEAFTRADANKDGVVTVAELQALRPRGR